MSVKIGLALGSGAARGWAHIGVIRALEEHGIEVSVVSGCSIGAIVGAAYTSSNLDALEKWIRSLNRMDLAKYAGLGVGSGFINTSRLNDDFALNICPKGTLIESFDKPFGAVATDLTTGREVWFTEGDALTALWASIAVPGVFPSVSHNGSWLVDGGLVNPIPVSMCRSLGAEVVIAVGLNSDIVGKRSRKKVKGETEKEVGEEVSKVELVEADSKSDDMFGLLTGTLKEYSSSFFPNKQQSDAPKQPSFFDTIASSVNIMQDRIARSRMAGDPPDVLISPRLSHIGLMEFHRAEEVIKSGYDLTMQQMDKIRYAIGE
ncbi:patatin-like phospholipase family protein [Leucothrix arctica]|uniref:Patatin n=1 Tax=Leucothrix arctica TaxID=1481894 RepID=A0A317C3X5_9GAMM|nr:patatin-like phospholipase family protein [Leucothrix arctica]PWQ92979.1 patatin [Leucothrix arctica]